QADALGRTGNQSNLRVRVHGFLSVLESVIVAGLLRRDVSRRKIGTHPVARPSQGVTIATAAGQGQAQALPRGHLLAALAAQLRAVGQFHPARRAGLAALAAAGWKADAVEHGVEPHVITLPRLDLDHLAKTAAELAGAA